MRVLFTTTQWPTPENPSLAPFVLREVESLRNQGVTVEVFVYEGGWRISKYVQAIRDLRQRIIASDYDIVHARFGQCGLVARAQWKVPVVLTYGGSDVEGSPHFSGWRRYRHYILRLVSWLLSLVVDEVIVVSDQIGRRLPRRNYHVIPSGVDLSLFQPIDQTEARCQLNLPLDRQLILFAGDPTNRRKRYGLAVEVCERASRSVDLELVVLSGKPSALVPPYMSASNALLLTSTNEGSPNVVKEALACNLPVVSVDIGDVRERIGGLNGCAVCASDEPEEIAEALLAVLLRKTKPALRSSIKDLDIQECARRTISVYERMLHKSSDD
ncbi:MAG: glycosyltransferase [Anaerolineales bacterium]